MLNTPKSALIAAASIFAVSGLALAPSFAQETGSINYADVLVQNIDTLSNDDQRSYENLSPAQLAMAQEKLSANPSLVSALNAKGVQLKNVVRVIEFPNGSALVYQR
jgi:uncharacterized protein HemY